MARPRKCNCELSSCTTCTNRNYKIAWLAKNPNRAKTMQREWADRRRASENVTEIGRQNALDRWRKAQIAKAARVRREQDAEMLNTYKGKLAAFNHAIADGAIELAEWIETDWRPNLPENHRGNHDRTT